MDGDVMVFAPAPQLTITIEDTAGRADLHLHPGGQGVWQARMVRALGGRPVLCAVLGGEPGVVLGTLLDVEGVPARTVHRPAGSGWYVHDRRGGSRRVILEDPGAPLARHDLDELYNLALAEGLRAGVALLSGPADPSVVSPEVYRRLTADLTANGCRVVADLSGAMLHAVLAGGVTFVKVSHEELLRDGLVTEDTPEEAVRALLRLRDDGAGAALVSRAERPALALLDGTVHRVEVPRLQTVEPRGSGDSMTAAVATVLSRGGDLEQAVLAGAAAGAVNVTRHGLGSARGDAVEELLTRVQLVPERAPTGDREGTTWGDGEPSPEGGAS